MRSTEEQLKQRRVRSCYARTPDDAYYDSGSSTRRPQRSSTQESSGLAAHTATIFQLGALTFAVIVMVACAGMTGDPAAHKSITIAVSPTSAALMISNSQRFDATVAGTDNTGVTWAVDGTPGGNAAVGVISNNGLYTAPSKPGSHTVTATSLADATKDARASVKVDQGPPSQGVSVLTERYDLGRTGQNLSETILTPGNINFETFGKIGSYLVDGVVYAQPLYVSNLSIAGGTHNVVFAATEHDSVYAFDADTTAPKVYWQRGFTDPGNGITTVPSADVGSTIFPEVGITGTPVIDPSTGIMYFVTYTKENGLYVHRLHAVDIVTGQDRNGGAVTIAGKVPGSSDWGNDGNGNIVFNSQYHLQRPGLLLLKGVVFVAFGSHGDNNEYHGWVMAYDASTLRQLGVWNTTPDGHAGAIWAGGTGLSADPNGSIYLASANGDFGLGFGPNASDSVVRLTFDGSSADPTKAFTLADYFAPDNEDTLASDDNDLGSSGLMLIPGTHLGIVAGKEGSIYVLNLNNLGHYNISNNNNSFQFLPGILGATGNGGTDENFSTASYFNGNIYYIGDHDSVKQFAFENYLSTQPIENSPDVFDELGAQPIISANGTSNAILWAIEYVAGGVTGELRAYDAYHVSRELYTSSQAGGRDSFGGAVKFSVPTVANGKVYIGTQNKLVIFGNF